VNTRSIAIVADEGPLSRATLREAVTRVMAGACIAEAESLAALEGVLLANPDTDLILLDSCVVDIQGFSALVHLCARHPSIAIAIISALDGDTIVCRSLALDASGATITSGNIEQIGNVLHSLHDGGISMPQHQIEPSADRYGDERDPARNVSQLSPQQLRVLMSLAKGPSNKTIAQDFGVTEATIKAHMTIILRKLGLERRTQAALLAQRILRARQPSIVEQATNGNTFATVGDVANSAQCPLTDSRERGKAAA
jgi:DNA-binding NarL/FixJ family response regulator